MVRITPIQKTNSLYNDKNIPFKCLVFFYKVSFIIFGLDFGFIEFKTLGGKMQKIISFVQCVLVSAITLLLNYLQNHVIVTWYFNFIIQYLIYVLILMRIKKEATLFNIIHDLRTIDLGLKVNHASYKLEIKLFIVISVCFTYRILMTLYFYWVTLTCGHQKITNSSLYFLVLMALDVVRLSYAYTFYAISCRLKELGSLLTTKQSGFLSVQYLYRYIVDIAEHHKEAFAPVVRIHVKTIIRVYPL